MFDLLYQLTSSTYLLSTLELRPARTEFSRVSVLPCGLGGSMLLLTVVAAALLALALPVIVVDMQQTADNATCRTIECLALLVESGIHTS
jgi:hypothetical protein